MQVSLIVNPNAGNTREGLEARIAEALGAAGYTCQHLPTQSEADLEGALQTPADLVVAAGGDGTLRAVMTRMVGRPVPLMPLPLGTANNVGRALGLTGTLEEWLSGLARPAKRLFDLGVARGPWGRDFFLEGAGVGLFAHGLANYGPDEGKSPLRAMGAALRTLREFQPRAFKVWLDGQAQEESLVVLEAMNTPSIGPRLRLAPEAKTDDGCLDVITIGADQAVGFTAYVAGYLQGQLAELPNVTHRRCRKLALEWDGSPLHIDAELRESETPARVEFEVLAQAIEIWLPAVGEPADAVAANP